jgi:glycosyltransferase involved in cell wall biosynthesis
VKWLSGAQSGSADTLADQVRFSDPPPAVDGPRRYAQTFLRMAAGVLEQQVTARPLEDSGVVITEPSALRPGSTYLASELFVKAHYRHMLLRRFTEVRLPDPIDVLHLTAPLPVRIRGVRTVTTIHDLVPIRLPYATPDNKAEFIHRVRTSAALSDLIVTVSEASKRDIVEILDVDPSKVAVTYQPTDLLPLAAADQDSVPRVLRRYDLVPDSYALFVGALEPKKNLRRLIEAFLEIDTVMPLAIVGRKAWLWDGDEAWLETLGANARARLRFLGYVSREDLRRLYVGAQMLLFPSLYEGFGLPVLEAMTMGCPVLTSRTSSLPEVCGEAALYVDSLDRDDIRKGIERLLADPALRADLARKGEAQSRRFSFENYVDRLRLAYAGLGSK